MYQVIEFNLDDPAPKWKVGKPVRTLEEARRIRNMTPKPRKKGDPEVRNIEEVQS